MIWNSPNGKWTIVNMEFKKDVRFTASVTDETSGLTYTVEGTLSEGNESVGPFFNATKKNPPKYLVAAIIATAKDVHEQITAKNDEVKIAPAETVIDYGKNDKKASIFNRFSVLHGSKEKGSKIPSPPCSVCGGSGRIDDDLLCPSCDDPLVIEKADPWRIDIKNGMRITAEELQAVLRALDEIRKHSYVKTTNERAAKILESHLDQMLIGYSIHQSMDHGDLVNVFTSVENDPIRELDQWSKRNFMTTYKRHLRSMGMTEQKKYTIDHVQSVYVYPKEAASNTLKVTFDNGNWWHYRSGEWW